MKRVFKTDYDERVKEIEKLEEELTIIRKYKGDVAIHQGDNWHDNPILYQTELKETALMAQIKNLKDKLLTFEIISDRSDDMIDVDDILHPNLVKNSFVSDDIQKIIQEKQNYFIKSSINKKINVIATSESGYDELLLYRIAYLVVSSNKELNPNEIELITPNNLYSQKIFDKLSYYIPEKISINNIGEFASEYTKEKISICDENTSTIGIKKSNEFKNLLDEFLNKYLQGDLIIEDLTIDNEVLFTKDEIKKAIFNNIKSLPDFDWASMYFINKYKNDYEKLSKKLTEKYSNIYLNMSFDDPKRKEYITKANEIRTIFKEKGTKIIKAYFKKLDRKPSEIYSLFIIDFKKNKESKDILEMKLDTLKKIKKHNFSVYDIFSLMYIKYSLTNQKNNKKHIIVTEIQNYNEWMYKVLNNITSNSGMTIFERNSKTFNEEGFETIEFNEKYLNSYDPELEEISKPFIKKKQIKK